MVQIRRFLLLPLVIKGVVWIGIELTFYMLGPLLPGREWIPF